MSTEMVYWVNFDFKYLVSQKSYFKRLKGLLQLFPKVCYNHLEISSFTKKQMGLTHCLPQLVPLFAIISSTVVIFNHCLPLIVPQFAIFLSHSLPKLVSWFALVSPWHAIVSATGLIPNSLTDRK